MRFLIDAQLPPALAFWLRERGHEAEHVFEVGFVETKDNPVWQYAGQHQAVVITKDEDFAEWVRRGRPGPSVVWLRLGNSTKRMLLAWLELRWTGIIRKLEQGERLVEVR